MNTQTRTLQDASAVSRAAGSTNALAVRRATFLVKAGEAMHLGRPGGDLTVVEGRVWLTRDGDLGDHFVEPGQKLRLAVGENAVIEPALTGGSVTVRWYARRQSFVGAVLAEPLRGFAFLAARGAEGLAALARNASEGASKAQGRIAGGDSVANWGVLK